jgi:hypothetical protein
MVDTPTTRANRVSERDPQGHDRSRFGGETRFVDQNATWRVPIDENEDINARSDITEVRMCISNHARSG